MSTQTTPTYLHYRLKLCSPAIVSTLSGDPDSAATQPFIPGGAIRGAVAARLLSGGVKGDSDEFRRLILSGGVRYLHAYPELSGDRALPTPSSWKRPKNDPDAALELAAFSGRIDVDVDAEDFPEIWPEEAVTACAFPFTAASVSSGGRSIATPRIGSRLHQQRDRVKGRPWTKRNGTNEERRGVIFPFEYLEANQVFRGVIQLMPAAVADIERIKELLGTGPVLVGRSRRAGYGGEAEVELTGEAQREYENVSGSVSKDVPTDTCFRAMLASAYIGRDPTTGQIDPAALQQELCRRLKERATIERARWTFESVGAFNQKWRLEVPQAQAVAGGAVLVLRAKDTIPVVTLHDIEHGGLGERRTEGFGRVLFLEHSEHERNVRLRPAADEAHRAHSGSTGSGSDQAPEQDRKHLDFLEQKIVLAAARSELDRVAAIDLDARMDKHRLPTNSLIGRLRTLFRTVIDEQTAQAALTSLQIWCSEDDNPNALKRNAREKLDRCKISGISLRQWLRRLAEPGHGEAGCKSLIQAAENPATLTGLFARNCLTSPDAAQAILHGHSALLRVHLIDALLAAMARMNRGGAR